MELSPEQARLLGALDPAREERVPDLARSLGVDQAQVAAAATLLANEGLIAIREAPYREYRLTQAGSMIQEGGLPESRIRDALDAHGGAATIPEVATHAGLQAKEVGQALKGLKKRLWVEQRGETLALTPAGRAARPAEDPVERLLAALRRAGPQQGVEEAALEGVGAPVIPALDLAGAKNAYFEVREKTHRWLRLTPQGAERKASGLEARREVTQITPELLASGEWREVRLKPYDITLATEARHPGKRHPLQLVIDRVRHAFLEMGFEEHASPWVESSFWDFDALFQPQDHPAREMQDTFYVDRPGETPLPGDGALVDRVRRCHEDGGDTGSVGWRYSWDPARARKNVLRTHTTATTIRALAADPRGPRKVFCVGKVFRRESIDYKHLPVFVQVDGIIIDDRASFSTLLGTLGAFYERMGFSRYYFRPGFFPYTEPSVEVFIWHEAKKDWFEMGGSGIFRPEVTEPLGCTQPVLAWGLGVDRLAMLLYDLKDIRDLYMADTEWLKGIPRCP